MKLIELFDWPSNVVKGDTVLDVIKDMVETQDHDHPFFIMDVGDIVQKVKVWRNRLPRVNLFYAVKCNDNPYLLRVLNALGTGFDCASKSEFQQVTNMGVDPSRIIFAHPVKPASHLKAARSMGIDLMTFDSKVELEKIKDFYPNARLILRIRCDAIEARCPLGMKFGVSPEHANLLLKLAKDLSLNVVGVAFHVGSDCREPAAFSRAIKAARWVFDEAKEFGFNFKILDIGGGFPGSDADAFDEIANIVNKALEEDFPNVYDTEVIAEPGRYIANSAFTLVTKVLSKQCGDVRNDSPLYSYYINDGVYGSFNCILYDHQDVQPCLLKDVNSEKSWHNSIIWGPTCDSFDKVAELPLPELNLGDYMYWKNMGAYTLVAASCFNGFPLPKVHMVIPSHTWLFLKKILRELEEEPNRPQTSEMVISKNKPYESIDNYAHCSQSCGSCGQLVTGFIAVSQNGE